jgi:hypothetical protein
MITATLLPGGTVIGMGNDRDSVRNNRNVLREMDLAGNPVCETNLAAVNAQLAALGRKGTGPWRLHLAATSRLGNLHGAGGP